MAPLCTIGYERFAQAQWLDALARHNIEVVVDVRDLPLSRKPGFSKSRLEHTLADRGIRYVHLRSLGNPKVLRQALKDGLAFEEFATLFRHRLDDAKPALAELRMLAVNARVCLLCFEEDPRACHRSLVAERVQRLYPGTTVEHIRFDD